jgi:hypothetical protein
MEERMRREKRRREIMTEGTIFLGRKEGRYHTHDAVVVGVPTP